MQDATCTSQMKEVGNTDLRIACGYAHVVKALNSGRPGTVCYLCTNVHHGFDLFQYKVMFITVYLKNKR